MSDPRDTNFTFADFRKLRRRVTARAFDEKGRNKNAGEKIAFVPVRSWSQSDTRGTLGGGAIAGDLANDIASASFLETNRHFRESI
jgi:hypothetical protein